MDMCSEWHCTTRGLAYGDMTTRPDGLVVMSPSANLPRCEMPFWTHVHAFSLYDSLCFIDQGSCLYGFIISNVYYQQLCSSTQYDIGYKRIFRYISFQTHLSQHQSIHAKAKEVFFRFVCLCLVFQSNIKAKCEFSPGIWAGISTTLG